MRGRAYGLELSQGAPVAVLTGPIEREVVSTVAGGDAIDVGPHGHEGCYKVRTPSYRVSSKCRSEGETGNECLFAEPFSEDLEKRDGVPVHSVAFVDATAEHGQYDKTLLLLLGQERAGAAVTLDRDTLSFAAPFNSGLNFLNLLGLSGGMPTLVSIPKERMKDALSRLGVRAADLALLGAS